MKLVSKALLFIAFFSTFAIGYSFASAEETLPLSIKNLIRLKKAAEIETEAAKFSQGGNNFLANLAYGEAFLLKGDCDQAEAFFRKAMEINPAGIEGKIGIAKTLAGRKEVHKAIGMLKDALRMSPHPLRLYYEMGLLLEASGDDKGAALAFEQGLERYFAKR